MELKPVPVDNIQSHVDIEHVITFYSHSYIGNILFLWIQNIHLFQVKVCEVLVLKPEESSVGML